jgi:hypothetical protein
MSDEVIVDQVANEAVFSDDETDIFVDSGNVPPEQQRVIDELRAKQAELQAQVNPVEAMKAAIQGLGGQLNPKPAPADVKVTANVGVNDWNQYKNEFNAKVFEDPFTTITDILSKSQEMQSATVANQNLAYSRRIVQIDPATKDHYKKWSDEVETEVAKMPVSVRASNPNVYEDALRIVRANHMDEMIEERMAAERTKTAPSQSRPIGYSETPSARPAISGAPVAKNQVRISGQKMGEISAYANEWGIPEEAAIRLFKQRNWL